VEGANAVGAAEQLDERPVACADRDALTGAEMRLDGGQHLVCKPRITPLQIEHELGGAGEGREEVADDESWSERAREPPPVPEDRNRPQGLQVAHLEAPPEEVNIRFDRLDAELLRRPQGGERVARTVRDDEWATKRTAGLCVATVHELRSLYERSRISP
jgi:hypothetical protein